MANNLERILNELQNEITSTHKIDKDNASIISDMIYHYATKRKCKLTFEFTAEVEGKTNSILWTLEKK